MNKSKPLVYFVTAAVIAAVVLVYLIGDSWRLPSDGSQTAAVEPAQTSAQSAQETTIAKSESAETTESTQQTAPSTTDTETASPGAAKLPSFDIVRVEEDGAAVIAGQAEPGAEISLMLDGTIVGTAIANARGEWVVIPDRALPKGAHNLVIVSKNAAGEMVQSEQTVAIAVPDEADEQPLIVLSQPSKPSMVLQKPAADGETKVAAVDSTTEQTETANKAKSPEKAEQPVLLPGSTAPLVLEAVDYNDAGDILFSGRSGPGETVRVYVDNIHVGDALANQSGFWVFRGKGNIKPGLHTLRIDQVRVDGKVALRRELPFNRADPARVVELKKPQPNQVAAVAAQPDSSGTEQGATQTGQTTRTATASSTTEETTGQTETAAVEPANTQDDAANPAAPKVGSVVIQPGNNLWNISRVIYGRGVEYSIIYEANKDQIRNPHRIYPGQIFETPGIVPPREIDPKRRDPLQADDGQAQ